MGVPGLASKFAIWSKQGLSLDRGALQLGCSDRSRRLAALGWTAEAAVPTTCPSHAFSR